MQVDSCVTAITPGSRHHRLPSRSVGRGVAYAAAMPSSRATPSPQIFAQRVSDRNFDALNAAGDEGPAGIGSDGTAMLVVDETPFG